MAGRDSRISAMCAERRPMPAAARPSRLVLLCLVMTPTPLCRCRLLRREAGTVDLRASAGGHVDPGIACGGLLRLTGARVRGGLAIVLACGRDAEALLRLEGGRGSGAGARDQRQSESRGDGGGNDQRCFHGGNTPLRFGSRDEAAATSVMTT